MRFGAFGDIVLLTVLLRQLHARFGKPVDVISSGPWTAPLLQGLPALGRLFIIRSRRTPYWMSLDQRRLVSWLRSRGPGPTWYCDMHTGKDLLLRGGIPEGFICDSRAFQWDPEDTYADRYVRLANETPLALAGHLPPSHPAISRAAQLILSPKDRAALDAWLARGRLAGRPYIIVHPGSRHIARRGLRSRAGAEKYWPESHWGELIKAVRASRPDHLILLTGTKKERSLNTDIIACSQAAEVYNVAGELSVRTLLALLERAQSMISVDTGPAHAAAALGVPTVGLFAYTSTAALYRPGGATTPAVALTGSVDGVQCMRAITVDAVFAAWVRLSGSCRRRAGLIL
jgi:heptosyltransferase-2/heptosyltransferase-3